MLKEEVKPTTRSDQNLGAPLGHSSNPAQTVWFVCSIVGWEFWTDSCPTCLGRQVCQGKAASAEERASPAGDEAASVLVYIKR